jgi:hypothetical protein
MRMKVKPKKELKMKKRLVELLAIIMAVSAVSSAGTREIRIELHLKPEFPLDGSENVYVGPIMVEPREGENIQSVDMTAAREFEIFLRKILRRDARLHLVPKRNDLRPPTTHLSALLGDEDFWTALGEETGAEFVIAASIDVKVLDRAGYTTEEYVSPQDGKTYFRQVMVEETGFSYDILLVVVDATSGEVAHREQITDFQPKNERKLEEYTDMFTDLYTLQNRLTGIFVPRAVQVKRAIFSN